MKILKRILLGLAVIFVVIQFFRPARHIAEVNPTHEVTAAVAMPSDVQDIIRNSCYDCHSNNTRYPWYAEVMPAGWFLASHIKDAKQGLNFSEFATGSLRRQYHKLEEISEQIEEGEMPLPSYLILHRDAELTAGQKETLHRWVEESRASMKARYPADSLERRRN